MSNIDKQALRQLAEKAISAEGVTWWSEHQLSHEDGIALHDADGKFIAAANPATVLALLDELEAAESGFPPLTVERLMREKDAIEKRVVELEARMVKLPERYEVEMCPTPSPDGEWYSREDILAALVSAGVSYAAGTSKGE
ncbi:ead/Ea22-like family protein [Citrobacter koseri]|uniref:ead/Ea22-like family protein n=1 Tax=Citrobacter koseri TaxID=545 RepID=UPI00200A2AD5|nr:ead/Ea22-like family protein [Citrobacter koseri]